MEIVNVHEAKTRLSALIKKVLAGEKVIIARNGDPKVELIPFLEVKKKRIPGLFNGKLKIEGTWEDLDKEVLEMFEESEIFPDEKNTD
jgi:prevent-host-death family protein